METTTKIQGVPVKTVTFRRAYIWQLPVRFFHWINAFALVFLILTGFLIANPPAIMTAKEASGQFWMGYIREIHFISAYAMVAAMFMRLYWAFAGNRFANWRQFVPFDKEGREKMWHVMKYDIFLFNEKEYKFTNIPIGHNTVAAASYFVMFVLAIVMMFTGFALYAPTSSWFFPKMFAWFTHLSVSYTHLDVYKRQLGASTLPTPFASSGQEETSHFSMFAILSSPFLMLLIKVS